MLNGRILELHIVTWQKKVNVELAYNTLMPDSKIGHFTNLKVVKIAF